MPIEDSHEHPLLLAAIVVDQAIRILVLPPSIVRVVSSAARVGALDGQAVARKVVNESFVGCLHEPRSRPHLLPSLAPGTFDKAAAEEPAATRNNKDKEGQDLCLGCSRYLYLQVPEEFLRTFVHRQLIRPALLPLLFCILRCFIVGSTTCPCHLRLTQSLLLLLLLFRGSACLGRSYLRNPRLLPAPVLSVPSHDSSTVLGSLGHAHGLLSGLLTRLLQSLHGRPHQWARDSTAEHEYTQPRQATSLRKDLEIYFRMTPSTSPLVATFVFTVLDKACDSCVFCFPFWNKSRTLDDSEHQMGQ
mmetsp:Transcript_10292/g.29147  ORF Transcript_10292/g.29147 Transcript_10292/m.29147 type:complete len:303 (-) Transcript_10292:137-1045(-)